MSAPGSESHDEQTDYDARFAEIVAQLSGTVDPDALAEQAAPKPEPEPPTPPALPVQWRVPDSGSASDILEDDGTYEPPPPAPLPRDDVQFWAIWATLVGGPLWLIYLFAFQRDCQPIWWVLACLVCILGVVLLVLRQPNSRDEQDPFDDGARL
ncbi:hypothetical protein [Allobranchiibius sp. CTAmp26]|uniref:hypothetical protein n=1 Tax=Allobranchiibius sp. CTAmp26 TaxID=2815214 RepID=UPI001AA0C2A0|nr:hypothetical protein [Allobranchiibius sp. CTAmp26]MBO1755333.1 hypothetical protein [Allobranchiibius sp. CTAmp26]